MGNPSAAGLETVNEAEGIPRDRTHSAKDNRSMGAHGN